LAGCIGTVAADEGRNLDNRFKEETEFEAVNMSKMVPGNRLID